MRIGMLLLVAALLVLPVASEALEMLLYPDPPGSFACGRLVTGEALHLGALLRLSVVPTATGGLLSGVSVGCGGVDHPVSGHVAQDSTGRYVGTLRLDYLAWATGLFGTLVPAAPPNTVLFTLDAGTLTGTWVSDTNVTGSLTVAP